MSVYQPSPIDTTGIELPADIVQLTECLAENTHDLWAAQRFTDGWRYGFERDDLSKQHPCLVSYCDLPESEKAYDRKIAMETLKTIVALGYVIMKKRG